MLILCFVLFGEVLPADRSAIEDVFAAQVQAWNNGDLEGYMQGYWQSEELSFVGSKGLKHGWQQTLDHYKRSYGDRQSMGTLSFKTLKMESLGRDVVYVVGQWSLVRGDKQEGYFSLIWKRLPEGWRIVADHSS